MKLGQLCLPLFTRVLALHMRNSEPIRYRWHKKRGFLSRLWNWLHAGSDWDSNQW